MSNAGELLTIPAADLLPHPHHRPVRKAGPEWTALLKSVKERGVVVPLLVRPMADGTLQVIDGHRRTEAAKVAGIEVPCIVLKVSAAESLEIMLLQSFHTAASGLVWPARLMAAVIAEFFSSADRIAERLSLPAARLKDLIWLLELPDEVLKRLDLAADDECRVSIEAAIEILKVPQNLRPRAIELVLRPEFVARALNGREASEVLNKWLTAPEERRLSWQYKGELEAERLAGKHAVELGDIDVRPAPWTACKTLLASGVDPFAAIPESELSAAAPKGARWADIARRYGLNVFAVPANDDSGNVFLRLPREAVTECEAAAAECRQVRWLVNR